MIKCYLIRHSKTYGNTLQRYIGITDEPLCQEGIDLLKGRQYPECEKIFVSPLKRCRETTEIIYPGKEMTVVQKLAECDFGEFENKNYMELSGNPEYQKWIDSNGMLPFPNGESRAGFQKRCVEGFLEAVDICIEFARPRKDYYQWQLKNGEGFLLMVDDNIEVNFQKL